MLKIQTLSSREPYVVVKKKKKKKKKSSYFTGGYGAPHLPGPLGVYFTAQNTQYLWVAET